MCKRIISSIIALSFIGTMLNVHVEANASEGNTFYFNVESSELRLNIPIDSPASAFSEVIVLPYDFNREELSFENIDKQRMLIKRVRTRGGAVSDTILLDDRDSIKSGEYIVYTECGDYIDRNIFIIPNSGLSDAVSEVNSSGRISSAAFGADEKVFADNKVIVNSLLANAKTAKGFTNQSFIETYLQSEGVAQLKNGSIKIDDFADLYSSYFDEVFNDYNDWTETRKQTYSSVIKAYSLNSLSPEQIVNKSAFVTDCRTAADSYALSDIVIEYINKNKLSSGIYNSLNDYYKNKVFVDLYEKIGQINTDEEIYSRFISICNDYNKTSSTAAGSSGGETRSAYTSISAPAATSVPSAIQTPKPEQTFADTAGHWAEEYIKECYSLGLVSGFDDNTFRPETNITRAETAVIISRLLGLAGGVGSDFYDVAVDAWYNPYVTAANKAGIVLGDEGYFYPNSNITRQDMAVMLMRVISSRGIELSGNVIFNDDSDISDYAKDSISTLAANNIITGDNDLFSPKRNLTRAEAAALIYRVRSLVFNIPDSISPVDTPVTGSLNSEYLQEARALINALTDNEVFKDINNTNVTRGDFISAIVSVLGGSEKATSSVFSDAPVGSKYADDAAKALQLGIIAEAELLLPDEEIPFNEAVAMVTKAMGFSYLAEKQGGYPQGYLKIAQERKLLKNVKSAEFLSYMNMNILLYNMLQGEIPIVEYRTSEGFSYKYDGTTLLSSLYDIKSVKGIITRNFVTSYDMQTSYSKDSNIVAVEGNSYNSDINIDRYFGMNCIVFYRDDGTDSIVSAYPVKNRELTVDLEDISEFNDTLLKYTDSETGREKRVRTAASYLEVYNGKVTHSERNHITDNTGTLRLVDNDNDGIYDVLFISHYTYLKVKNLDVNDRIIEDENSSKYNLSVDEDIVSLSLGDHTGKEMEMHEIRPGDVLAILKSLDGTVAAITVLGSPVTATAGSVSENHITLDGTEYTLSDYAVECGKNLAVGVGLSLYINNKEIAYLDLGEQQYQYGYVTKLILDDSGKNYLMRTFSTDGKFYLFQFANKLKLDGTTYSSGVVYETLNRNFAPQLIRYKLNNVGALAAIDTAEVVDMSTASKNPWEDRHNEDNKLKKYLYASTSFVYRSNKAFGMNFNGVGATVFMLPVTTENNTEIDVNNSSEFEVVDISQVATGVTYSYFDVYDVDENGSAAVFVSRKVQTANSPYSFYGGLRVKMSSGMISSVKKAVSELGDEGRVIELWTNGKFYQYFMPNSVLCPMAEGESLAPGDIVRYNVQNDEIKTCILDFNASTLDGNKRYDNRSAVLNGGDISVTYNVGKLYSHNDSFCTHSNTFDGEVYNFTPSNLFNTQVNSAYICRFDSDTKTVRTIALNDLRDYRVYGDDADYVVIKQASLIASCMYVYGKGDGN